MLALLVQAVVGMHTLLYITNMPLTQITNSIISTISASNITSLSGVVITDGALIADVFCTPTLNTTSLSADTIITSRLKLNNDTSSAVFNSNAQFGVGVDATMVRYGGTLKLNLYKIPSFKCIPRTPVTRVVYNFTGANQTFTVPADVRYVYAKLWGAGGGSGRAGGWTHGNDGGGGGHARGIIPVTPAEALTLVVGRGGYTTNGVPGNRYGGGGGANNATNLYAGDGGGYAGIFRGSVIAANALLIAGGGGAGGSAYQNDGEGNAGGAGGGNDGCGGESAYGNFWTYAGTGGTGSAGGSAPAAGGLTVGTQLQGGNSSVNDHGGGGGGGYWGGGGGAYVANNMGGGGGGSGYVAGTCITGETYKGCRRFPAYFWDEDLEQAVATGATYGQSICSYGGKNCENNLPANVPSGGHAKIIIYY